MKTSATSVSRTIPPLIGDLRRRTCEAMVHSRRDAIAYSQNSSRVISASSPSCCMIGKRYRPATRWWRRSRHDPLSA